MTIFLSSEIVEIKNPSKTFIWHDVFYQIKDKENANAIQLGFGDIKEYQMTQSEAGHLKYLKFHYSSN